MYKKQCSKNFILNTLFLCILHFHLFVYTCKLSKIRLWNLKPPIVLKSYFLLPVGTHFPVTVIALAFPLVKYCHLDPLL